MTPSIVKRRTLLTVVAAWPLIFWAHAPRAQSAPRRIGLLTSFSAKHAAQWYETFRQRLGELGWFEGKNIAFEYRYADGNSNRLPELAADLVRRKVDIILASTGPDARAAWRASGVTPIVVAAAAEPLADGLIKTLARPGGNVTGLSLMIAEMAGKRLEMLKEVDPKMSRVAVLWNPQGATVSSLTWQELQAVAPRLNVELHSLPVTGADQIRAALEEITKARAGALFIAPDPMIFANLDRIAASAIQLRVPSISHGPEFSDAGGLIAYGPDRSDMFRRAATYVDKILKGAKPAELPIEQPTKFELVINLKTAKALGIAIPQTILIRADRLIQ